MIYVNVVLAVTVLIAVLVMLFKSRKMGGDVAGLSVRLEERDAKIIDLKTALAAKECELRDVNRELSDALGEVKALKNSLEAKNDELLKSKEEISRKLLELEEKLNDKFQVMASKILDEKTAKMNEEGSRSIRSILEPFGITLQEFKDSVNKYNTESIRSRGALAEQLDKLGRANDRLNTEANNLTNALKSNSQKQGRWGEVTLEMLLETAGLERGIVFETQTELKNEAGENLRTELGSKMRPDVIINLPDDRRVIIDAKCSLTAHMQATNVEIDEKLRESYLADHVKSVKSHIDELSKKAYDNAPGTLDYVFMFIPSEAAYAAALQADPGLWEYANSKRIALVCPMTLLAVLRVVNFMWTQQKQIESVEKVFERGRLLYEKAASFVDSFLSMHSSIKSACDAADKTYKLLASGKGNLISQAESLLKVGVSPKKKISSKVLTEND